MKMGEVIEVRGMGIRWEKRIFIKEGVGGVVCVVESHEDRYKDGDDFNTHLWKEHRKPQKPKPFTWEDRDLLRDNWLRNKNTGNEYKVDGFMASCNNWVCLTGSWYSPETLFKSYEFLDGSVCGVAE